MATPRSRYMRISDLVLDEDWDNDTCATVIRLLAWMRQRWARERLTAAEACEALINGRDAMRITCTDRPHVALQKLASLPLAAGLTSAAASLVKRQSGSAVHFNWPNVAEYQGWDSRDSGEVEPEKRPVRRPVSRRPVEEAPKTELPRASRSDAVRPPDPPAEATERAERLAVLVREALPGQRIPADLRPWALELDRLHRIDGWPWSEIDATTAWALSDSFWRLNIRSAGKLRDQFARLNAQRLQPSGGTRRADPKRPAYPGDLWEGELEQERRKHAAGGET